MADYRHLAYCQQQSAHAPLVTEFLKDGVERLLPVSAAYASYPVSSKYGVPVVHQGRLDDKSTRRLVERCYSSGKALWNWGPVTALYTGMKKGKSLDADADRDLETDVLLS